MHPRAREPVRLSMLACLISVVAAALIVGSSSCTESTRRGPVSLEDSELIMVDARTFSLGVPSCNGDPELMRLEEGADQVRVQVVTTTHSGPGDGCLDTVEVKLREPIGSREVVDITSGANLAVTR